MSFMLPLPVLLELGKDWIRSVASCGFQCFSNLICLTLADARISSQHHRWYIPNEASSFCSSAIRDSFTRASTYSFGSICFGSLLVAIVQALRALYQQAQNNDDCQVLACIIQCILACIQGIIEYLNKWAFVYVGEYR